MKKKLLRYSLAVLCLGLLIAGYLTKLNILFYSGFAIWVPYSYWVANNETHGKNIYVPRLVYILGLSSWGIGIYKNIDPLYLAGSICIVVGVFWEAIAERRSARERNPQ